MQIRSKVLSKVANEQTDRQTNNDENVSSLEEVTIVLANVSEKKRLE